MPVIAYRLQPWAFVDRLVFEQCPPAFSIVPMARDASPEQRYAVLANAEFLIRQLQDAEGEVYALDYIGGGIYHLAPKPQPSSDAPKFPRKLSETGLFTDTKELKPAKGLMG